MAQRGVRLTEKHRTFAALFLEGDEVHRGNWEQCSMAVGFLRIPGRETKPVNNALAEHAKTMAPGTFTYNPDRAPQYEPIDPDMAKLSTLDGDWDEMARVAKRIMQKAISGHLELTSQQVQLIKESIARAEGKVGQVKQEVVDDGAVVKVVLLPTIDTAMGPVIDLGEVGDVDPGDNVPGLMLRHAIKNK